MLPAVLAGVLALGALAGCGDEEEPTRESGQAGSGLADGVVPEIESGAGGAEDSGDSELVAPPCPAGATNCARASGEILYVERVDPDGDGDAHFVLLSGESITGPGISVIDVRAELRPSPLPRPGDELAASGPVFEGSHGQRQIQADAVRVGG